MARRSRERRRPGPRGRHQLNDRRPVVRAIAVAAVAVTLGSVFVTSYTLGLGKPARHRIPAALVGPAGPHTAAARLAAAVPHGIGFQPYPSLRSAHRAMDDQRVYAVLVEGDAKAPGRECGRGVGCPRAHGRSGTRAHPDEGHAPPATGNTVTKPTIVEASTR